MGSVEQLSKANDELVAKLATSEQRADALERELKILRDVVANLEHGLFGKKSERIDPAQLALFARGEQPAPEPEQVKVEEHKRKTKGHGRSGFPEHLPRQIVELDLDDADKCCPDCKEVLRPIGEDTCERGHFVPARIVVMRYLKKKYACPNGHCVKTPDTPPSLIDRCKYEPSVYAHLVASKYQDHLPLNRLEGIFKRHGMKIPKQTMWEMLSRVDEVCATPILEQMRKELLEEPVIQGDDTPVPVRLEDGKGARQGRVWAWISLGGKKAVYVFTMTKERDGPVKFLGDWSGTGIFDGASNFDEVVRNNGIIRAGCWSHARRKLKESMERGSQDAARLLVAVQRLFRLERTMERRVETRGLSEEDRLSLRRQVRRGRSAKLVDRVYELVDELMLERSTLPKSLLGKALTYLANQEDRLRRFLDDERIPVHNNDTERTLRHLAVGRKNWMVFGSPKGGQVGCNLYSLMLSCRAVGVNPEAYMADVLLRVSTTPTSEIASLTPWAWATAHPEHVVENG